MRFETVQIRKGNATENWDVLRIGDKSYRMSRGVKGNLQEQLEIYGLAVVDCMFIREKNLILNKYGDKILIAPADTSVYPTDGLELLAGDDEYKMMLIREDEYLVRTGRKFIFLKGISNKYEVSFEEDLPLDKRTFHIVSKLWKMNGAERLKHKEKWCKFYNIDVVDGDVRIWRYGYQEMVVFDGAEIMKVKADGGVDYVIMSGEKKYLMIRGQKHETGLKDGGFKTTILTFHSSEINLHPDLEKEKIKMMDEVDLSILTEIPHFDVKVKMKRWEYTGKSFHSESSWYDEAYQSGYSDYTETSEISLVEEKELVLKDIFKKSQTCKELMG